MTHMDPLVLTVDMAGLPQAWVELEEAITYHAKLMVAWSIGATVREFRGGWQRDGTRSRRNRSVPAGVCSYRRLVGVER